MTCQNSALLVTLLTEQPDAIDFHDSMERMQLLEVQGKSIFWLVHSITIMLLRQLR